MNRLQVKKAEKIRKSFTIVAGVLLTLSACETVDQSQLRNSHYKDKYLGKDRSVEIDAIWDLPASIDLEEIRKFYLHRLKSIEEDVLNIDKDVPNLDKVDDLAGRCHLFSNKLTAVAKKIMADQRDEEANVLILKMSVRTLEAMRKVRNASIKTSWTADTPWLSVLYNDNYLHILDVMNLIAYDDDYDSHNAVEYELTNIVTQLNEAVDSNIYQNVVGEIEYDSPKLIEKFYEKLQKVGSYSVEHIEPVRKFLGEIKRQALKRRKTEQ